MWQMFFVRLFKQWSRAAYVHLQMHTDTLHLPVGDVGCSTALVLFKEEAFSFSWCPINLMLNLYLWQPEVNQF